MHTSETACNWHATVPNGAAHSTDSGLLWQDIQCTCGVSAAVREVAVEPAAAEDIHTPKG
jgi:hypothetical protein